MQRQTSDVARCLRRQLPRTFQPSLLGRPVIVLSNNGCAVSRSNEAKAHGVQMGQPWSQCRELEKSDGLVALSSNYALYGDMSNRMKTIAAVYAPRQEIYSVDDSFPDLTGVFGELVVMGRTLRRKLIRLTGIPTFAGLDPTKTLAKFANHVAESAERKPGRHPPAYAQVFSFRAIATAAANEVFATTAVKVTCGISRRISAKLNMVASQSSPTC